MHHLTYPLSYSTKTTSILKKRRRVEDAIRKKMDLREKQKLNTKKKRDQKEEQKIIDPEVYVSDYRKKRTSFTLYKKDVRTFLNIS